MTILLSALAVTFAAFCVWLTLRVVNRRERWAKWMLAIALALPVLYVVSFGPAFWIYGSICSTASSDGECSRLIGRGLYATYRPLIDQMTYNHRTASGRILLRWVNLGKKGVLGIVIARMNATGA
jgi:hypothetical protein